MALLAAVWLLLPAFASAQSTHLLIVVGLGGDPEHGQLFEKWAKTLADTATTKLGVPKENVILLPDQKTTKNDVVRTSPSASGRTPEPA